jgi:hypothetical protein
MRSASTCHSFFVIINTDITKALTKETKKSFDFPKQHAAAHLIDDIKGVGVTANYTTRTGEGMHQEVRAAYEKTNGKNAESQVRVLIPLHPFMANRLVQIIIIDARKEAMARLKMVVDVYDREDREFREARKEEQRRREERRQQERQPQLDGEEDVEGSSEPAGPNHEEDHWTLASRIGSKPMDSFFLQNREVDDSDFAGFDALLRDFFATWYDKDPVPAHDNIKVRFVAL